MQGRGSIPEGLTGAALVAQLRRNAAAARASVRDGLAIDRKFLEDCAALDEARANAIERGEPDPLTIENKKALRELYRDDPSSNGYPGYQVL